MTARFTRSARSPAWVCGACAYTCPTCHCFDIADEGNPRGWARVKNWESCQFSLFTAHASGHNPRESQPQRQRIFHKFRIYPEKFGEDPVYRLRQLRAQLPGGIRRAQRAPDRLMDNIYKPDLMEVVDIRQHTADVKSVKARFLDPAKTGEFNFRVGQFGILSAFGYGESTFNICSSSNWRDFIEFCFRKTGRVTEPVERRATSSRAVRQQLPDGGSGRGRT